MASQNNTAQDLHAPRGWINYNYSNYAGSYHHSLSNASRSSNLISSSHRGNATQANHPGHRISTSSSRAGPVLSSNSAAATPTASTAPMTTVAPPSAPVSSIAPIAPTVPTPPSPAAAAPKPPKPPKKPLQYRSMLPKGFGCALCTRRFETARGRSIHAVRCAAGADTRRGSAKRDIDRKLSGMTREEQLANWLAKMAEHAHGGDKSGGGGEAEGAARGAEERGE